MAWMRLDTRDVSGIEYDGLDVTAYGLLMLLAWRSWDQGGIPDDKGAILRALRGRIDGASFDAAWAQVRPLLDADTSGKLHLPWVEEARSELLDGRKNEAEKKRNQRLKARQGHLSPGTPLGVPRESTGSPRPTDGRTDEQTDGQTQKRAPRAPSDPAPWVDAINELVPARDSADWCEACAEWARARRDHGHKALKGAGWRRIVAEWLPRGLVQFRASVQQSASQGWQGLFAPKAAPGTIQTGPNKGKPDGRAWLEEMVNGPSSPAPDTSVRETTARVVNP